MNDAINPTSPEYSRAKNKITKIISKSKTPEDPTHADNVLYWLLQLEPNADEILQLAAFAHDVERAMPDRFKPEMFENYDEYKEAHAARAGKITAEILVESGYSNLDANRADELIRDAEFQSDNREVQLICDADSISFFDNNLAYYIKRNDDESTKKKIGFMYNRASERAQTHIARILRQKPELNLLHF